MQQTTSIPFRRHALVAAFLLCVVLAMGPFPRAWGLGEADSTGGSAFIVDTVEQHDDETTLSGRLMQPVPEGDTAFFQTNESPIIIEVNGSVVFTRAESEPLQLEAFGYGWNRFRTTSQESGAAFKVTAYGPHSTEAVTRFAASLFVGDGLDLLESKLQAHALQLIVGLVVIVLGLSYIVITLILRHIKRTIAGNFVACGIMLVAGGLCTLIDYDFITIAIDDTTLVNWADFLAQTILFGCLLLYFRTFLVRQNLRAATKPFAPVFAIATAASIMLTAFDLVGLHECVAFLMSFAITLLVVVLAMLALDYRAVGDQKTKLLLQSSALLGVFALAEAVHFLITGTYWIIVFQCGLLIFGLVQFFIIARTAEEQLLRGERMEKAEAELAQNRSKIMLSQIQPHFLYNTLAAIARLCDKDPQQAKEATVTFADYLRGNMDSLSQTVPVPFERELRHVRLYLSLEQMRFGDDLHIVYDIQTTAFTLPALSVQPLVENAVRYGVGKQEEGGTVCLATRETADSFTVTVSDDGVGFDPWQTQDDGRTHIGIDNVATRLQTLSQATLHIESTPGKGTCATITIPKEVESL